MAVAACETLAQLVLSSMRMTLLVLAFFVSGLRALRVNTLVGASVGGVGCFIGPR